MPRAEGNSWVNQIVSLGTNGFQFHGALELEVHKELRWILSNTGTQRQRIGENIKCLKNEKAKGEYEGQIKLKDERGYGQHRECPCLKQLYNQLYLLWIS